MKGTIKAFNTEGKLIYYWTFQTQETYKKALEYCKMNCTFYEVIFND